MSPAATASRRSRPDVEAFRRCVAPLRARVEFGADGWPIAPGRYGRLEWRGLEASGEALLYAFTNRVKLIGRLRAVVGVRPKQTGDREAVVSFRADDTAALVSVTRLLKIHRRGHRPDAAQRLRNGRRAPLQSENPALETTRNPADDPEGAAASPERDRRRV
jgi:hypothetical protein